MYTIPELRFIFQTELDYLPFGVTMRGPDMVIEIFVTRHQGQPVMDTVRAVQARFPGETEIVAPDTATSDLKYGNRGVECVVMVMHYKEDWSVTAEVFETAMVPVALDYIASGGVIDFTDMDTNGNVAWAKEYFKDDEDRLAEIAELERISKDLLGITYDWNDTDELFPLTKETITDSVKYWFRDHPANEFTVNPEYLRSMLQVC